MHPTTQQFVECARSEHEITVEPKQFPAGTKTAADAAAAIDCEQAQIVKSIVLMADEQPVIALTSGVNRVDETAIASHLNAETVRTATPDEVKETVGWSIGGVPPFCHDQEVPQLLDRTLLEYETVWAAAGTPDAVFPIAPTTLQSVTDPEPASVFEPIT